MKVTHFPKVQLSSVASAAADVESFALARNLEVPVWVYDIDNRCILFANTSACRMWQADAEDDLYKRNLGADMSPTVVRRLRQYQSAFVKIDAKFTEQWTFYPNNTPKNVMVTFSGFPLNNGRMAMQCEVISQAHQTPQNLRSAEALLHTDVMIMLFSKGGPPTYLNPAAQNAFKTPMADFSNLLVDKTICEKLHTQVELVGAYQTVTKVNTIDGQRWFDLSAKTCLDAVTGKPAILLTAFDVSELKVARDTANRLANRDQLTDLYNRAYLHKFFETLSKQQDTMNYAAIFFDVDRFKLINDRHGHEAGDTVLKHIANQCRGAIGPNDLVARLGGDEFVIIISGAKSRAALDARISDLRLAISRPVFHEQSQVEVEISIGITTFSPRTATFADVLRKADIALYASKTNGRNKATYFTQEMGDAARARDQIEVELKQALKNGEFELFYQPRLDITSNKIIGAEGLVRWNHPHRGIVMPNDFIAICEETGMIDDLGRIVLELGCRQAIEWDRLGLDIEVSLNVSPRQFSDKALLGTLRYFARLPGFPIGRIELEITENALIGDHDAIAEKLKVITALGYRIAIDDFGSGYSNLSYISRFPLSCLKIDRSFIDQLPKSGPIVNLIVTLGQQLGATVVSEGVETQDQLDWLSSNNCNQAQGYLIARPMPLDAFSDFCVQFEATQAATNPAKISENDADTGQ